MELFFSLNFKEILFFWIWIAVAIVLWVLLFIRKKRVNFNEDILLKEVYGTSSLWYYLHTVSILMMSFLIFLYLAQPYGEQKTQTIKKEGIDIEIVMDLSYSMIADDIAPSRLEVSKTMFWEFIDSIFTDRVGLILFSGKPFQSVPLSYDYNFLKDFVADISIDIIDQTNPLLQGTAIWDALILASDALVHDNYSDEEREKVIILLTDGEANRWAEPLIALRLLVEQGIRVYTIWVWKDETTTIEAQIAPGLYQTVEIWGVDEEILIKIASETWGEYFRADSASTLKNILERISELEMSEIEYEVQVVENSYTRIILLLLFLFSALSVYTTCVKRIRHV